MLTVNAQTTSCTEPVDVDVPCIGLLVPYSEADDALKCRLYELPLAEAKLATATAGLEKLDKVIQTEQRRADQLNSLVIRALDEPWYESNTLWFGVGVITTAILVVFLDQSGAL